MRISIIVAAADNQAIGANNQLLWHLPNDLKYFKNTTWAMPVLMGRKTFESVGKLLPGRTNIIITRQPDWNFPGAICCSSLESALEAARATNCLEVFIIGGGEIYREAFPIANRIYLTRVHTSMEADTFFPPIEPNQWTLIREEAFDADEKHAYSYRFQIWDRKSMTV